MNIDHFKRIERAGALKAAFQVVIPEWDLTLKMTYFQKDTGESWFGYPSKEYTNELGEKKYSQLVFFGEKGRARFEKSLKEEVNKHLKIATPKTIEWEAQDIPF